VSEGLYQGRRTFGGAVGIAAKAKG
jgi:hypothetical protein